MNDHDSFDLGSAAALLVVIVITMAVAVRLIPILFQALWAVVPSVVIMIGIVGVLRGMLKKLLD